MTIAALTRRLLDLGASPEVIAVAVEAVTLASRDGDVMHHASSHREAANKRARAYRKRLKNQRKTGEAKANDVASTITPASRDASRCADNAPLLSFNKEGTFGEAQTEKQVSKKARSENARARGQRMVAGALLTDEFLQAAIDLGAEPSRVPGMWAEFVDYWVAIPGMRGLKTDWLATWRNRVRDVLARGGKNGQQQRKQGLSDLAFDLAEETRSAERARGLI